MKSMKKNNSQSSNRSQEFASETVIRQVKEQNRQAEMKKQQASGKFSKSSYNPSK
ncbi:gamma-type small acid-soluble spore protein [uncultured Psychrobacillus sp.]|uniref:gamma-type small acid-soluble spore protein n=1 Tax=uncultured Psychrobacillus sp. TaxID=1551585 RepID=UPI00262F116D|nr:gamma-type small acid-soluble spore protein [uncultured Psychrobacillus sp.]